MLNKICTMTAKSAPYPPCTPAALRRLADRAGRGVTAYRLKYRDRDRMLRRVTQPPHIAGPLAKMLDDSELATHFTMTNFQQHHNLFISILKMPTRHC